MARNYLGVPLGTVRRPAEDQSTDSRHVRGSFLAKQVEFIASIVEITVDDVCIGNSPLYFNFVSVIIKAVKERFDALQKELNSIMKWVAYDLLVDGFSVYKVRNKDEKLILMPVVEEMSKPLKFYLTDEKQVLVFLDGKVIDNCLVYINYNKTALRSIADEAGTGEKDVDTEKYNIVYAIEPRPIQLANVTTAARDLLVTERAMIRYRKDLSKLVRFVTVDIGPSQGDQLDNTIDTISQAVNANSISLEMEDDSDSTFDDEIAVFPTRGAYGKPELSQWDIPVFDIKELADLDYHLGRLFLAMRFPKSYADFSNVADSTAVSLIRGDVRYSHLINSCRSLIEDTTDNYLHTLENIKNLKFNAKLTETPTPEDEEVINSLQLYTDFLKDVWDFIFADGSTKDAAESKVKSLKDLLGNSVNLKSIQDFIKDMEEAISKMPSAEEAAATTGEGSDLDGDLGGSPDMGGDLGGAGSPEPTGEGAAPEGAIPEETAVSGTEGLGGTMRLGANGGVIETE